MKILNLVYALMAILLLTGCEGEVTALKYNDGYLEIYSEAELRYINEVSQRNAISEEPLMTVDGAAIPFGDAKLRLMKDIKIKDNWTPIRYGLNGTIKSLDGNHHTITFKNLKLELLYSLPDSTYDHLINYGLFDILEQCEIRDLKLNGDITITNTLIHESVILNMGALAGKLASGTSLKGITNSVNISFADRPNRDDRSKVHLDLGGIAGIMDGDDQGVELLSDIKNEGKLSAEGCSWTQVGGISASLTNCIIFGDDVNIENKGNISVNLSNSGDFVNNFIGGVFGQYWEGWQPAPGYVKNLLNLGKIYVVADGATMENSYSDAHYDIGGVCGYFRPKESNAAIKNLKNSGEIEIEGDYYGQSPSIGGVIGYLRDTDYENVKNDGVIKVSPSLKKRVKDLFGCIY